MVTHCIRSSIGGFLSFERIFLGEGVREGGRKGGRIGTDITTVILRSVYM